MASTQRRQNKNLRPKGPLAPPRSGAGVEGKEGDGVVEYTTSTYGSQGGGSRWSVGKGSKHAEDAGSERSVVEVTYFDSGEDARGSLLFDR